MQQTIQQLELVRRRARLWLVTMRGSIWLAAVIAGALVLGFGDYLLRLPSWARAILLAVGVAAAGYFAVTQVMSMLRIRPALTSLALRLERLQPAARGRLASAVAFASARDAGVAGNAGDEHDTGGSPVSAAMARRTADEGTNLVNDKQVRSLLDPTRPLRALCVALIGVFALVGVAVAAPANFNIAVQRWSQPFGDARWPNRYGVESRLTQQVAPNNAPLRAAAQIVKGDYPNLRAWVNYQFYKGGEPVGEPESALMTRQDDTERAGRYQRLIEPIAAADEVRLTFTAGDDTTIEQSVTLIEPPAVASLVAEVEPPAYAARHVAAERHDLIKPATANVAVTALTGSRVKLHAAITGSFKPLDAAADTVAVENWVRRTMIGLLDAPKDGEPGARDLRYTLDESNGVDRFTVSFTLASAVQFRFTLADEHANVYEDQRVFGVDARADALPRATVFEPGSDQQVLATAKLELAAEGQDDVAVGRLALTTQVNKLDPAEVAATEPDEPTARVRSELDLGPMSLKPGDEVAVAAVVRDTFSLDGAAHDPVTSTARIIRIISEQDLAAQMRVDLAKLRQDAIRTKATQNELIDRAAANADRSTAEQQRQLSQRLAAMQRAVAGLSDRADRNRLNDDTLRKMIAEAGDLTRDAERQATQAADQLDRAARGDNQPTDASPDDKAGGDSSPPAGDPKDPQNTGSQPQPGDPKQPGDQKQPDAQPQPGDQKEPGSQQPGGAQQQPTGQQQPGGQSQPGGQKQPGAQPQQDQQKQQELAQAQQHQKETEKKLGELVDLLDQGGDAYELKQKLTGLLKDQQATSQQTRQTMPRTLGKETDQLTEQDKKDLDDIAKKQDDLAKQASDLAERMRASAAAIARQSNKPENQAMAQAMRNAADKAAENNLKQQMSKASQQAGDNQLAQAQQNQAGAESTLQQMLNELNKTEQLKAEMLRRKLAQLAEAIEKLLERQKAQLDRLTASERIDGLADPQITLRRNTMDVAAEARETSEETVKVAEHLDAAADDQASAVEAMRLANPSKADAVTGEANAVKHLEDALALAKELSNKANEDAAEDERAKLAEAYKKVLEKQIALNDATATLDLVAEPQRDRKWRADALALVAREEEVRKDLLDLKVKIDQTIVYLSVHEQMDEWCDDVIRRLRETKTDGDTRFEQDMIALNIQLLIDSLTPEPPSDEFAEDEGGGGGGGEGGGKPPLIPPMAELKALKARQTIVHAQTRAAGDKPATPKRIIDSLAEQQGDLAETGRKLMDALQQGGQPQLPDGGLRREGEGEGDGPVKPGPVPGPGFTPGFGLSVTPVPVVCEEPAAAKPAPANDQSLDDLLDLDTPKPAKPQPAPGAPADADKPKPADPAKADKVPPEENFAAAVAEMRQAGDRLSDADPALETQRLQQRVIERLNQLIADARQKQSKPDPNQKPKPQDTGGQPQAGPPQQGPPQQGQGNQPATQAGSRGSVQNRGDVGELGENSEEWAKLPDRVRKEILQGIDDQFSELYRNMTERYYKRLAEESNK